MDVSLDRERDMITHPLKWPHVALPLVRKSDGGTAIFCPRLSATEISANDALTIFIGANLFVPSAWKTCEQVTYQNVDALLADGWRVD